MNLKEMADTIERATPSEHIKAQVMAQKDSVLAALNKDGKAIIELENGVKLLLTVEEKLWICGRYIGDPDVIGEWQFQGVFDTEAAAVAACRDKTYFIGPATLNEPLAHESINWEGSYYPKLPPRDREDETMARGPCGYGVSHKV
jgi:hypothetical protein